MTMRAYTEAMLSATHRGSHRQRAPRAEPAARAQHQSFVDLMIPIVKGWFTETAQEVTYLGVQCTAGWASSRRRVHHRDARIITIYEGTTGIQAPDQVVRLDAGRAFVDGDDPRVTIVLRGTRLLDEAHPAVHLNTEVRDFLRGFREPSLDDRNHQVHE